MTRSRARSPTGMWRSTYLQGRLDVARGVDREGDGTLAAGADRGALGADADGVLPDVLRLTDLCGPPPRFHVDTRTLRGARSHRQRHLTREFDAVASAHAEELAAVVPSAMRCAGRHGESRAEAAALLVSPPDLQPRRRPQHCRTRKFSRRGTPRLGDRKLRIFAPRHSHR